MKIIKIQRAIILDGFGIKPAHFDETTATNLLNPFDTNKLTILNAAFDIEGMLEKIISHYFFDRANLSLRENATKFQNLILSSDWCSFSSKRKLISHIINEKSLLKGKEKNDYEELLRKIMSYRNAFAHGEFATNGEIVRLKYFEGSPRIITIDDTYLSKVETDINICFETTFDLSFKTGTMIKGEPI